MGGDMEFLKNDNFEWEGAELIGEVVSEYELLDQHQQQQTNMALDIDKTNWGPAEIAAYALLKSKRKKCVVPGCTSRSIPLARSYHQLPVRNMDVWQQWVEAIRWAKNDPDWIPSTDQPLVCSRHFHPVSDFVSYEASSRSRLHHTAVPSLYIDPPEGTLMDPKFEADREPPQFVGLPRYRTSQVSKGFSPSPRLEPFQSSSGASGANFNITQKKFKVEAKEPREFMEVTPEYNFEEPSEYDGAYGLEDDNIEDGIDEYEEKISYRNANAYSNTRNSDFYADTDMNEEPSYPKPPTLRRILPSTVTTPKLSISSLLGKLKSDKQKALPSLRPQLPPTRRGVVRPNIVNPSRNLMTSSSIKIEKMDGGRQGAAPKNIQRKILMKVPPTKSSGEGGTTQKHKIGMSKCRLIIESIERELESALQEIKARVAGDMDVPIQVVHGVWQIKDKILKGNSNS